MWRAAASVAEADWSPAIGMHATQVAVTDYAPAGWPPHTYTIIRRVRVDAEAISTDPRSRRRRTIDRDQLALVLDGIAEHGWATSFIVTNLPTGGAGPVLVPSSTEEVFFAPDRIRRRTADWGADELRRRQDLAWQVYLAHTRPRVTLLPARGPEALTRVYHEVRQGHCPPEHGHILFPAAC